MGAHSDESVRRFAAAITRCDADAAFAVCDPEVEFLSVLAVDGRVVIEMTMHARGKGSGTPLAEFAAHIWTLGNGKLLRNQTFREREQAARAAGLSHR